MHNPSFTANFPGWMADFPLLLSSSHPQKLHQGLKHLGWNASKKLLWTERGWERIKSMAWKQQQGRRMALCSSEAHFIFHSVTPGRKQSQVTDLMLITPELSPFRETKACGGHSTPAVGCWRISSEQKTVGIVLDVCEAVITEVCPTPAPGCSWFNLLPVMTRSGTSLITRTWRWKWTEMSRFRAAGRKNWDQMTEKSEKHNNWREKGMETHFPSFWPVGVISFVFQ